jgi:cellulose synthase/poly-beta-1,6-N-acetylglucosamine synthase-like glycosyltransferase
LSESGATPRRTGRDAISGGYSDAASPLESAKQEIRGYLPHGSERHNRSERPIGERVAAQPELVRFVVAIIPAYNEEERIGRTLRSLANQTRPVDAVIVVADNCTDGTVAVALAAGASVVETVGNPYRKAGALNFALAEILPMLNETDAVLLMDADTQLSEGFIAATTRRLWAQQTGRQVGGVGGIFAADDDDWNTVRQLQTNEYVRYARHLGRRRGRALVMTGTGSVFSVGALRRVVAGRISGELPDNGGTQGVYDTSALTEDNELTLCLKALGYRTLSPKECLVVTAMMPSWKLLYQQRRRWQRGALENIIAHQLRPHTLPYILRQFFTYVGVIFVPFYIVTLTLALTTGAGVDAFVPLWVLVAFTYIVEQTWSVRRGGWRSILMSMAILPELFLNLFLGIVYAFAFSGALWGTSETWGRSADNMTLSGKPKGDGLFISGSHRNRTVWWARIIETSIAVMVTSWLVALFLLPKIALPLAWTLLAIYVLSGFALTIFRLIPLKMT